MYTRLRYQTNCKNTNKHTPNQFSLNVIHTPNPSRFIHRLLLFVSPIGATSLSATAPPPPLFARRRRRSSLVHKNTGQKEAASNSSEEAIVYVKSEDDFFYQLSSWSFRFPLHTQQLASHEAVRAGRQTKNQFGLRRIGK